MTERGAQRQGPAETIRDFFARYSTRLALSILILVSICPFQFVDDLWWAFAVIFGVEAVARAYLLIAGPREGRRGLIGEVVMLLIDVVAWASFLPLAEATGLRFLRLVRFARLGLLVRYWGGTFRSLWGLLRREERARQIRLLLVGALGLTLISATILHEMTRTADAAELGLEEPVGFADLVWWGVRQLNDPGNLVSDADHLGIVALSLVMTLSGIVLFSFLVGIGTNVVEDLMDATREQPMGYRGHSVLVNAGEAVTFLLDEVERHFRKHVRPPHWMVLGREPSLPALEAEPRYRRIHYRQGSPYHADDLAKVDAATASRLVVLADLQADDPDADTASALLSIRQVNAGATLFAEVLEEKNATAVLAAGGPDTVVVATHHLLSVVLANSATRPAYDEVVEELLTVRGTEIYTYLFSEKERPSVATWPSGEGYGRFLGWAWRQHGCVPIGLAAERPARRQPRLRNFDYLLDSAGGVEERAGSIRGVVGLASSLDGVSSMAQELAYSDDDWSTSETTETSLPTCRALDEARDAQRFLVCRYTSRTPLLLEHLLRLAPDSTITVMVRTESRRALALAGLLSAGSSLARFGDPERYAAAPRGRFKRLEDGSLNYTGPGRERPHGRIELVLGDWTSRTALLAPRDDVEFDLFEIDQVIIQTDPRSEGDPDARSVMALLKLADLKRHPELGLRFKPSLRIAVEVVDPLKAELLERRFTEEGEDFGGTVTVVRTEWLRHLLMFQATVVPGFATLFYELFSPERDYLHRLTLDLGPGDASRLVSFGALLEHVYEALGMTLIGYQLREQAGAAPVVVSPGPDDQDATVTLGDIATLFALRSVGTATDQGREG